MMVVMGSSMAPHCRRSWSISEESLKRYVHFASESCIQELLSASSSSDLLANSNNGEEWKILSSSHEENGCGVEISKRRGASGSSFPAFRSRSILKSVSPQQFISVANVIDAARQWDSDLVEARYIKDVDENLSIIQLRYGEKSNQPLFRNREFVVYERRETMEDGTVVVAVASLPKEMAAGLGLEQQHHACGGSSNHHSSRPKNNAIRGLLLNSGWVVEKLQHDSSCCMVTYVVQVDPGGAGWLPKCFVNRLNIKLVMIIDKLRNIAQSCPKIPQSSAAGSSSSSSSMKDD